jgi:hypothetical protein
MHSNEEGGLQNNSGTASRISGCWEIPHSIMLSPWNRHHCGPGHETLAPIGRSELNRDFPKQNNVSEIYIFSVKTQFSETESCFVTIPCLILAENTKLKKENFLCAL